MNPIEVHEIATEIANLADLLAVLFGGADAENATDGARLVAFEIGGRADRIKQATKA